MKHFKNTYCRQRAKLILKANEPNCTDAELPIWYSRVGNAETQLLSKSAEIDGDYYGSILPLPDVMEGKERYLAATVL